YVGCLCPGPVDTEFNKVANVDFALKGITPQYCTQYAYQEMMKGTMVIVPTLRMKAAVLASKVLPESLVLRITAMQQKRKKGL
ncbi:MAG: ketoacyl reductase, partial [Lachnospiraceae bacterium]|nr:ketoacyl reductase [Lachnospiraceae bacterium]